MAYKCNIGVYILLRGVVVYNNSEISIKDIGETDNGALLCFTDLNQPYENVSEILEYGNWYFPNNSVVGTSGDVYTTRGYGVVRLHRRSDATMPTGWFHCKIFDANRINQIIFVEINNIIETMTSYPSNNIIDTTVTSYSSNNTIDTTVNQISNPSSSFPVEAAIAGSLVGGLVLISAGFVLVLLIINRYKYLQS